MAFTHYLCYHSVGYDLRRNIDSWHDVGYTPGTPSTGSTFGAVAFSPASQAAAAMRQARAARVMPFGACSESCCQKRNHEHARLAACEQSIEHERPESAWAELASREPSRCSSGT